MDEVIEVICSHLLASSCFLSEWLSTVTSAPSACAIFTPIWPRPPRPIMATFFPGPAFQCIKRRIKCDTCTEKGCCTIQRKVVRNSKNIVLIDYDFVRIASLGLVFFHPFRLHYKSMSLPLHNTVQGLYDKGRHFLQESTKLPTATLSPTLKQSLLSQLLRQCLRSRVLEPSGSLIHPTHYSLGGCPNGIYHCIECRLRHHNREAPFFQKNTE